MEIQYFQEASMEDSFIYKTFNNSNDVLSKIVKVLKTGIKIDKSAIEEQYYQMKRSYISPLTQNVIDAYDAGIIEIIYCKEEKIPTSIPFIVRKNAAGKIVSTIFISSYSTLSDDKGQLSIPMKNLYCIMESAFIALCIQAHPEKMKRDMTLQHVMMDIYNQMMLRIMNRDFALSLDQDLYNSVSYCFSKFFLDKIWEVSNVHTIYNYATANMKGVNHTALEMLDKQYNSAEIKDVSDLLEFIKTISPKLESLSVKFFIERYINSYNPAALLSMDYLPYLFFVVINMRLGSFIVSKGSLSDLIKDTKGINNFHNELAKLYS